MPDPRVWAALLLLVGCGEGQDAPRPPLIPIADVPRDGPGVSLEELLAAGADPARLPELLRRVGTPRDFERTAIPGGELQAWRYPGLSFTVRVGSGAERLTRVEVTGEGHRTADGLRVGMTREAVTGIRGQPSRREGEVDVHAREGGELRVRYSEEGVVEALEWQFDAASSGD